jgi:hypothetical protein
MGIETHRFCLARGNLFPEKMGMGKCDGNHPKKVIYITDMGTELGLRSLWLSR